MSMNAMVITIEDAHLPSWNTFYAGKHHRVRTAIKNKWRLLVREQLDPDDRMFTKPVHITVNAYYKGTPCDPDNVCAKLVIDALKERIIEDDTPQFIHSVTTTSSKWTKDRVVIHVVEV